MAKSTKNKKSVQSLDELYLDAIVTNKDKPEKVECSAGSAKKIQVANGGHQNMNLDSLEFSEEAMLSWENKGLRSSADHMTVILWVKSGRPISSHTIRQGLEKLGVVFGIDEDALKQVEEQSKDHNWQDEVVVAKGVEPGVSRRINYLAMEKLQDEKGWQVDGVELDFDELQEVFVTDSPASFGESSLMVKAVRPGEKLVEIVDDPKAKPGKNVFGTIVEVIEEPIPVCGANVRLNAKNRCIEVMLFGYLLIVEDIISVQLPVWLKPDHLAAYYINYPQVGVVKHPTAKDIFNILVLIGINKRCVSARVIKNVCEKISKGDKSKLAMIAEAVKPITGKDAEFALSFDSEKKAGTVRDDGSIDLRERKAVVSVKAGQLIAEKTLATNGVSGVTLLGQKLKATDGNDKKINFGSGVRREKNDEKIMYYAGIDGNVHFLNNTLTVVDIMQVDGDVDYASGNLDVNCDIEISGSVVAGFSVKAKGSIYIKGSVENGATIVAGDELIVKNGILGEDTRVVSMGDLQAGFIQDAEVLARGNVLINSYLYNARLRANGKIIVLKGQGKRSGRIVGGVCCSSKAITTCYAGSAGSSGTLLSIQPDPVLNSKFKKIEDQLQVCNGKISKISRTLPFDSFDSAQIKAFLVKIPALQRGSVIELLKTLNKLIKLQKNIREQKDIIAGQVAFALQHGVIRASSTIYQGSVIEFGDTKLQLNNDSASTLFKYYNGKIVTEN